jgi:radical SAM protein with 4Fe4S-binding SPASM domain
MIELRERLRRYPRHCVWELTLACNLRFRHCGSHAGAPRAGELSLEECRGVVDQLAALGCERLTLSGGEPTLHTHWQELGLRLSERGVRTNLISNGWSWSERELDGARRARLASVAFSLDGLEAAHDAIRRAGSFARVVRGLRLCVERGMPASAVTQIHRGNRRQLAPLRALLVELGVSSWQLQLGNPSGAMRDHPELVVRPEELLELIPAIAALRALPGLPALHVAENLGYYGRHEASLRARAGDGDSIPVWIGCSAGWQTIGIESDGTVKGCLSLPSARHGVSCFSEGNLRERSLAAIWERPDAFAYSRRYDEERLGGFCAVCRYRDLCRGGCTWTAYCANGRGDNPYCFYRQAVLHRRRELLDEEPTAEELRQRC